METGNRVKSPLIQNLISIIVPVYNGEAYIERCVESILAQTYPDWELLLMNGASTDNTGVLCDKWQAKDKRIRAFHAEGQQGVSAGRNSGLQEAKGEYIFFLDADDWLKPECLQRLYEDIQTEGVQIAGCQFQRCTDKDWQNQEKTEIQSSRQTTDGWKESGLSQKRLIAGTDFLAEGILRQDTRCWSKLYRADLLQGHFFREDYTIGEDMLFLWETAKDAKWISSSDYEGYCYYYNANGTMLKPLRESDIDQIRCWQLVLHSLQRENVGSQEENSGLQKRNAAKHDTDVISRTATILLISCMLVVGKLAKLPAKERKKYPHIKKQCSAVIKETLHIEGAYGGLDKAYRLKVRFYQMLPELYINLYHIFSK